QDAGRGHRGLGRGRAGAHSRRRGARNARVHSQAGGAARADAVDRGGAGLGGTQGEVGRRAMMQEAAHTLAVPEARYRGLRRLLVDEATGGTRHDVRNKLGSLGNGAFYVRRKLEGQSVLESDPRVPRFLDLIDQEAADIASLLTSRVPPPTEVEPASC